MNTKPWKTPIKSIASCSLQMTNDNNDTLTVYGDIYTVHNSPHHVRYKCVLDTSDDNYPDTEELKTGILLYGWELKDKNGNKIKSYKSKNNIDEKYINKFFDKVPMYTCHHPISYHNPRTFKELFWNQVRANMCTYKKMGFNKLTNNPDDINVEIKTSRYRIAFSHNVTGKMIIRDRWLYLSEDDSPKDMMANTLCSDYQVSWPDINVIMLENIEYMLNGKYVGVYKV